MKKRLLVVGVCLALVLGITFGAVVQAKAQAGWFIFGLIVGSTLNDTTNQVNASSALYQDIEAIRVVNILDVRYVDDIIYTSIEGKSFIDIFFESLFRSNADEITHDVNLSKINRWDFLSQNIVILQIIMSPTSGGNPMLQFYYVHRDRLPATYGMETGG
ncbi:MAG: hypothetical protein WC242_00715 [Candidatus Paceibacterota bacterium]|jgi:hypothetical protein